MKNESKRNGIIIGALLITIAIMTIGYAALATTLTVSATAKTGDAKWEIQFDSITKNTASTSDAIENSTPVVNGTSATFDVTLPKPGSKMVYDLVVSNTGTIDAELESITGIDELNAKEPSVITYKVNMLDQDGNVLATKPSLPGLDSNNISGKNYYRVTIEWPATSTQVPTTNTEKTGTINLNYVQK